MKIKSLLPYLIGLGAFIALYFLLQGTIEQAVSKNTSEQTTAIEAKFDDLYAAVNSISYTIDLKDAKFKRVDHVTLLIRPRNIQQNQVKSDSLKETVYDSSTNTIHYKLKVDTISGDTLYVF